MRLLVTDGARFIGSGVIHHVINNSNDELINLDKLTYAAALECLEKLSASEGSVFEQVHIRNRSEVDRVLARKSNTIIDLTDKSHVDCSIAGPADFIETNIVGTYILTESACQYWTAMEADKKTNFLFHRISVDKIYGDLPPSRKSGRCREIFVYSAKPICP